MKNHLIIRDLVQFKLLDPKLVEIKDNFLTGTPHQTFNSPFADKKGLIVRLAASHAGIITGNNTFYLPDKMRDGVPTFMENYGKPILTHHDENKDPIGRVIEARYVDTSGSLKDSKWINQEIRDSAGRVQGTLNEKLIGDFVNGKMPFAMSVDVVRNILDNSVLQDPGYEGLGYAEIVAEITDKDAIEKFLDGRYLTGSVSASTDRAVCSHCKQDWTTDGRCDHTPGSIEDGKKVYLIAGKFNYSEYSMVNRPADRHSKVLELYYNGVRDSVEMAKDNRIYEVNVGFPQYELNDNVQEDDLMKKKDKAGDTPADPTAEVKDSTSETPGETIEVKPEEKTPEAPVVEDSKVEDKVESLDDFFTRILDANYKLTPEDDEFSYKMMLDEMKDMGLTEDEVKDATLSAEKRSKLSKSTFCGPDKSFPVPDCAHVTAARRLVNRYKGAGNKDSILACVNRKAKALGCDKMEDKLKDRETKKIQDDQCTNIMHQLLGILEQNQYVAPDETPPLSEDDVATVQSLLKKLVGMIGKDNLAKAAGIEKLGLDASAEKTFCDEITSLEVLVGTLRDEISKITEERNALKEEYDILFSEMNALQDSVVVLKSDARKSKLDTLTLLTNLKEAVVKDRNETLHNLNDQVIDAQLVSLTSEVDMNKIVAKLNDGMSRIPTGEVENPSAVIQDGKPRASGVVQELKLIEENFTKLLLKDKIAADRYLNGEMNRLRKEGKIPNE